MSDMDNAIKCIERSIEAALNDELEQCGDWEAQAVQALGSKFLNGLFTIALFDELKADVRAIATRLLVECLAPLANNEERLVRYGFQIGVENLEYKSKRESKTP